MRKVDRQEKLGQVGDESGIRHLGIGHMETIGGYWSSHSYAKPKGSTRPSPNRGGCWTSDLGRVS